MNWKQVTIGKKIMASSPIYCQAGGPRPVQPQCWLDQKSYPDLVLILGNQDYS